MTGSGGGKGDAVVPADARRAGMRKDEAFGERRVYLQLANHELALWPDGGLVGVFIKDVGCGFIGVEDKDILGEDTEVYDGTSGRRMRKNVVREEHGEMSTILGTPLTIA